MIILSIILNKQLVNTIGLKLLGSKWSLLDLGMRITTASRHNGGKQLDSQKWLYTFKSTNKAEFLGNGLKVDNGPGPNHWLSRWLSVMTSSIQSLKKVGYNTLCF